MYYGDKDAPDYPVDGNFTVHIMEKLFDVIHVYQNSSIDHYKDL